MLRFATALAFCSVLLGGVAWAADEDPIAAKLATAKAEYEKSLEKARDALLAEFKLKLEKTRTAGDIKSLEKIEAELKAFESSGTLPKSVTTRDFNDAVRTAQARLNTAYQAAVKEYTMAGNTALAKAIQASADEFKKETATDAVKPTVPDDGLNVGTKLRGTALSRMGAPENKAVGREVGMAVVTRSGKDFTGTYGPLEIKGTINNGAVTFVVTKFPGKDKHPTIGNSTFVGRFDKAKGTLTGTVRRKDDQTYISLIDFKVEKE